MAYVVQRQHTPPPGDVPAVSAPISVAVVGVGGLGCHVAELLAANRSLSLKLFDDDTVSRSNLPRQWLYKPEQIGTNKAHAALQSLSRLRPAAALHAFGVAIDRTASGKLSDAAQRHLRTCDAIVDASDNSELKFALNDFAVQHRIALVTGGVIECEGFAMRVEAGKTPCLRCLFFEPSAAMTLSCSDRGVLAPLPGVVASVMVAKCWQLLAGEKDSGVWQMALERESALARERLWQSRPDCAVCQRAHGAGELPL